jgi:hypothetical protein
MEHWVLARCFAVVVLGVSAASAKPLLAQTVTIPDEYASHIRQRDTRLAPDGALFGDRVSLNDGGLEIIQTDVALLTALPAIAATGP